MHLASQLSDSVPTFRLDSQVGEALARMEELSLHHLPVLDAEGRFADMVSYDRLLDQDEAIPLGDLPRENTLACLLAESHWLDALRLAADLKTSVLALVQEDRHYAGAVLVADLVQAWAQGYSLQVPGSILVLSLYERDYALSQLSRLIEAENARIVFLSVEQEPDDPQRLRLTLKTNTPETGRIVASLERFKYEVVETFHVSGLMSVDQERLNSLLRYLSI